LLIAGAISAVIGTGIAIFGKEAEQREEETLDALVDLSISKNG
jgi:hypothetical protein